MNRPLPYRSDRVAAIYKIVCNTTGAMYIGSTIDLVARWQNHMHLYKCNGSSRLYLAMKIEGAEAFSMEIVSRWDGDIGTMQMIEHILISEIKPSLNTVMKAVPDWLKAAYPQYEPILKTLMNK